MSSSVDRSAMCSPRVSAPERTADYVSAAARCSGRHRMAGDRLDTATGGATPGRRRADQPNGPDPRSGKGERLPVPPAADEIRALAVTLNEMLDRLADAQDRQRSFVADAAHELRSPLASIQAQLEVAGRLGEGGTCPPTS